MRQLSVWAEHLEGFVPVGSLRFDAEEGERFAYCSDYLMRADASPIYPVLPLREEPYDASTTRAAFASLGPEGPVGHDIRTALRAGRDAVTPLLARLNHETVGALTFTDPAQKPQWTPIEPLSLDDEALRALSLSPEKVAFDTLMQSRLSLNGAVAKIGVMEQEGIWCVPQDLRPSTHILKAGSGAYPDQMLNEALCMRCARACGFDDAASTRLIVLQDCPPLLVSKRFDRITTDKRPHNLPTSMRLHQADFCQAMGISVDALKYTPADELVEGYTSSLAKLITQESEQRYGDRCYVFETQVFNYLIGNCDNHLKNLSLTWTEDWKSKIVSPLYDVTCTTWYPELSRDMGLGIGAHRGIDQIEVDDFRLMAYQLGIGWRQARTSLAELADDFERALLSAAHDLECEYDVQAVRLAEGFLAEGIRRREIVQRVASSH